MLLPSEQNKYHPIVEYYCPDKCHCRKLTTLRLFPPSIHSIMGGHPHRNLPRSIDLFCTGEILHAESMDKNSRFLGFSMCVSEIKARVLLQEYLESTQTFQLMKYATEINLFNTYT